LQVSALYKDDYLLVVIPLGFSEVYVFFSEQHFL